MTSHLKSLPSKSKFYLNVFRHKNYIYETIYDNGEVRQEKTYYKPSVYIPSKKENTEWIGFDHKNIEKIEFPSMYKCDMYVRENKEICYDNINYCHKYISSKYNENINYDLKKIKKLIIDIETTTKYGFPDIDTANEEVLLVSLYFSDLNKIYVIGTKDYHNNDPEIIYKKCDNEQQLLRGYLFLCNHYGYDVISGWNVEFFDLPYLYNRINKVLGNDYSCMMSPYRLVSTNEMYKRDFHKLKLEINGVSTLDYLELYKKFTYVGRESYKLDHIGEVELNKRKLKNPYNTFSEFYTKDWHKFVDYNIRDVKLVVELEEKLKLIDLAITLAYDAKINFQDIFSQSRIWDSYIYNNLKKDKIAIPPLKPAAKKNEQYIGAHVKEPIPGRHEWIVNFDLTSLYPHLILQYGISPESLYSTLDPKMSVTSVLTKSYECEDHNFAVAANGARYDKRINGILPKLIQNMYNDRSKYKKLKLQAEQEYENNPSQNLINDIAKYDNIQMAKKICLNSAYGSLGNEYFRYYNPIIAESITVSGRLAIQWIANSVNEEMNNKLKTDRVDYIVASDTDSIYVNFQPIVKKFKNKINIIDQIDNLIKKWITPYIDQSYSELAKIVNAKNQSMEMKREAIADVGIWVAKKRYILNVLDMEGVRYQEAKMKVCGLESVRSSVPSWFRERLKVAYKYIIDNDNTGLIDYIEATKLEFHNIDYQEISFPRSASGLDKYKGEERKDEIYKKGTPIQTKGSLIYNYYIKKNNLENKYELIKEKEKIKYIYLKSPNELNISSISFIDHIPEEFDLIKHIDYNKHYIKGFYDPIVNIAKAIKWRVSKKTFFDD